MERTSLDAERLDPTGLPPDDFVQDQPIEMANLDERDTGVPGTIFVSTALGAHGPRVKWYPGRAGRDLPYLIVSIAPDPEVRDDFLPRAVSRSAGPRVLEPARGRRLPRRVESAALTT